MDDEEITQSDREAVMRYWAERRIVNVGDREYESYIQTGLLPGGQNAADRLARHFARYRKELTEKQMSPCKAG